MKYCNIVFSFFIVVSTGKAFAEDYSISEDVFNPAPFVEHTNPRKFNSYLVQNLDFQPINSLKEEIEKTSGKNLIDRGEAHITVVNPAEFEGIKDRITIQEINKIALEHNLQNSPFEIICLGRGQANIKDNEEQAYFVVVKSPALLAIRKKIAEAIGENSKFDPDNFYPHITVGYTLRDLHPSDGVIKDQSSCVANITIAHQLSPKE